MNRHRARTKGIVVLVAAIAALASPAPASADAVADWNLHATATIVPRQPPHAATLSFAMVQGAVYDAVNAIVRTHRPYLSAPPANP
jgi:hypothetical protein